MNPQAEELLKLIEDISLEDTAKLDEINSRLFLYLFRSGIYASFWSDNEAENIAFITERGLSKDYTRSRDALKAIRPLKGGSVFSCHTRGFDEWECIINFFAATNKPVFISSEYLPTEELAELHAIIQAIDYERTETK